MTAASCSRCDQPLPKSDRSWSFFVPLEPPSQNKISGNKGRSRYKYKDIRDNYRMLFENQMILLDIPPATVRRRVLVTRIFTGRSRRFDFGNLVGGCKPLLDAMTLVGMILDDKELYLEDHYYQERSDEGGAHIVIEEGFQ